ncbi:hypothetical protein Hanom_Chr01g00021431 [Helianthus anomalus]
MELNSCGFLLSFFKQKEIWYSQNALILLYKKMYQRQFKAETKLSLITYGHLFRISSAHSTLFFIIY